MSYQFTKSTYWVDDLNITCAECLDKQDVREFLTCELIGVYGQEYVPFDDPESDDDGELACQYCRTLCTK